MTADQQPLFFDELGLRQVQADFSGGTLSSDGAVLLLPSEDRGRAKVLDGLARPFKLVNNSERY